MGYNGDVHAACGCVDWRLRPSAYVCAILECNAMSNASVETHEGIYRAVRDAVRCTSKTTSTVVPRS